MIPVFLATGPICFCAAGSTGHPPVEPKVEFLSAVDDACAAVDRSNRDSPAGPGPVSRRPFRLNTTRRGVNVTDGSSTFPS